MDVDLKYVVLRAGRVGGTDDLVFKMNIELVLCAGNNWYKR